MDTLRLHDEALQRVRDIVRESLDGHFHGRLTFPVVDATRDRHDDEDRYVYITIVITQYGRGRPLGTHIRRSESTIYYALFHSIAASNANMLAGNPRTNRYSNEAWTQVYRALSHGIARNRCESKREMLRFPMEIRFIASYSTI